MAHYAEQTLLCVIHKICQSWNDCLQEKGMINVQMFHNSMRHDATLKNVWYVPDAGALYSPSRQPPKMATAQPWMKKKKLFTEVMELLQHRVSPLITSRYWRFGCVFHDMLRRSNWQRKRKHCKYGMNILVFKISTMLWKCSSNMVLMWKQTKNFVTVALWEKHIGRASELGQADQA